MRVQSINLNLIPTGVMPIIHLSQYDQESDGALLFMIYNGSLPYDLTGCTAVIEGTKSDSTFFSYPCTVYNNYITSAVYFQMTALAEDYTGELRITNGGDSIGTLNFTFSVERAGVSTVDVSETEIPELLEDIQNSVDEAEYWAQQASQSAAGVRQWNGRSGSVLPMAGDYNASQITYDNTTSGLAATQAQAAIDELATEAQAAEARDGDAYNSATTYGPTNNTSGYPSYCIENSKIYKNIVSCTGVAPSADISGTYWEETDISTELSSVNSDITNHFKVITSGSLNDITTPGIYYVTSAVTDRPTSLGGTYIVGVYNDQTLAGIYIAAYSNEVYQIRKGGGSTAFDNLSIIEASVTGTTSYSGAISVPSGYGSKRFLNALITSGTPGFVVRRDSGNFTVFDNTGAPLTNTYVEFTAYFI